MSSDQEQEAMQQREENVEEKVMENKKRKGVEKKARSAKKAKKDVKGEKEKKPKRACSAYTFFSKETFPALKAEDSSLKFHGMQFPIQMVCHRLTCSLQT